MSKGVKTTMGNPIETADQSQWELTVFRMTAGEPAQDQTKLGPLNVDDSCVAWAVCGVTGSGTSIYPQYMNWLFGAHSLWRDTLLSPDGGEGLGPASSDVTDFVDSHGRSYPL